MFAATPAGFPGVRGLNARTDRAFMARHPERDGRPIRLDETALVREWRAIRAALAQQRASLPLPLSPLPATGGTCAPEDPFRAALRTPGRPCASDGRKCWPNEGWRDIADADMPCSSEARRSPRPTQRSSTTSTWRTPATRATQGRRATPLQHLRARRNARDGSEHPALGSRSLANGAQAARMARARRQCDLRLAQRRRPAIGMDRDRSRTARSSRPI